MDFTKLKLKNWSWCKPSRWRIFFTPTLCTTLVTYDLSPYVHFLWVFKILSSGNSIYCIHSIILSLFESIRSSSRCLLRISSQFLVGFLTPTSAVSDSNSSCFRSNSLCLHCLLFHQVCNSHPTLLLCRHFLGFFCSSSSSFLFCSHTKVVVGCVLAQMCLAVASISS